MSPPRNIRATSHGRKTLPAHLKPTKPPALKKNTLSPSHPAAKAGSGWSKSVGRAEGTLDPDDEEMACLPHFCAMCEKQIITPGSSILYCSESCRRKDGNKPLSRASITLEQSDIPTSPHSSYSFDPRGYKDIVPQRSPTQVRPSSMTFSDTSELSLFDQRPACNRTQSEATDYLVQFGFPSANPEFRRLSQHERHTSTSHGTIPSLSHTPGSFASPASSYSSTRRLPSRTGPFSATFSSRSVDLVTPLAALPASSTQENSSLRSSASTGTTFRVAEGELSYEKKTYSTPKQGSLKQLLAHESLSVSPHH